MTVDVVSWQSMVVFVAVDVLLCWAAGFLLAEESVVAGLRERFENWAYRSADTVRSADPADQLAADQLWDRAQPWTPRRWRYWGVVTFDDSPDADGRRVPHRRANGLLVYGAPRLDGRRLTKVEFAATVMRAKAADLWGCPKCAGMWGGAVLAAGLFRYGDWPFVWPLVVVLHAAGWGLARRITWGSE